MRETFSSFRFAFCFVNWVRYQRAELRAFNNELAQKSPGSHHATTRPLVGVVGKRKLNAFFAEQVAHSKELRYAPTAAFHAFAPTLFPKVFSQTWRPFSGNQDILELAYSAHSRLHFCKKSITLSKLPQEKNVLQATTANCIRKRYT